MRALSGITMDTHLLKMDVGAVEKALISEPYVAQAIVSRRYPNTVILEIKEREPEGMIYQNGKFHLVDQKGIILESLDKRPPRIAEIKGLQPSLLFPGQEIGGRDFILITALLGSMPNSLKEITSVVGCREGDGLYVESKGTRVIYGEASELPRKNTIAFMALTNLLRHYHAVEYIDISFPAHPVIKPVS